MTDFKLISREEIELRFTCSTNDFDFEFVIDSSGSIGAANWEKSTDIIADVWIETLQPSLGFSGGGNFKSCMFLAKT